MRKALLRLTLLLIILLALAGCTNRQPAPVATPAAQQATRTAAPAAEKAAPAGTQAVGGEPALTVEQVASIETYRMRVDVTSEGKPSVLVEVAHVKNPIAEDDQVTLYQNDQPTTVDVRYVNDVLYLNNGEKWTVISTFNLAELTIVTPAGLAAAAPQLTLLGEEEMSGRKTLHLHGDKNVIPDIQTGSDSLSVKNADDAQLDLWLDAGERFIVKLFFSLTLEGKTFTTEFLYYDFNAPIVVEVPTNVE